jgi:hypothetical protein
MKYRHPFRLINLLILITLTLSLSAASPTHQWRLERIDAGITIRYLTNHSLQLFEGIPSMAFGSDHLYYAYLTGGGTFSTTIVDQNWGTGMFASMAINPSTGYPRISYYDQSNDQLKYAEFYMDGFDQAWSIRVIDTEGGNKTAIALDNSARHLPHIAYTKPDGHVWHAWQTCSGSPPFVLCLWHTEEVDDTVTVSGANITLAIDDLDHLHMAYFDDSTSSLNYAYNDGNWSYGMLYDDTGMSTYGMEPSLAIDSSNRPAIAYETESSINYAYKNGDNWSDWTFEILYEDSSAADNPGYPSLQLPNHDVTQPWISFIDGNSYVRLAIFGEGTCPGTTGDYDCAILDNGSIFGATALAVEEAVSSNLSHLIYIDKVTGELHFEDETSLGTFSGQYVTFTSNVGLYNSLVMDASGPHISYYDRNMTIPKYTEIDDTYTGDCGAFGSSDLYDCVGLRSNTGDEIGWETSIDLDLAGAPHIALYNYNEMQLEYASLNPYWSSVVIDTSTPDIGKYPALAFSPTTGLAGIAYKDVTNGWLKYAEELAAPYTGGNCGPSAHWKCVDIQLMGSDTGGIDLDIDPYGTPFISFVDGSTSLAKVASYVGSGGSCAFNQWQCDTISGTHYTYGGETSILAESTTGIVMVSFYDSMNGNLMFASFNYGGGWKHEYADYGNSGSDVGNQNSLTLINGKPVIAYVDDTNVNLMVSTRVGNGAGNCGESSQWYCETVDSSGSVGYEPSIAHTAGGQLYISYYDWTNGDLKMAIQEWASFLPLLNKP